MLSGATVQTNSKNGFDIIFSNGERRSMQASSDEDRDAWVAALRETIRKQAQKKLEALQVQPRLPPPPPQPNPTQPNPTQPNPTRNSTPRPLPRPSPTPTPPPAPPPTRDPCPVPTRPLPRPNPRPLPAPPSDLFARGGEGGVDRAEQTPAAAPAARPARRTRSRRRAPSTAWSHACRAKSGYRRTISTF